MSHDKPTSYPVVPAQPTPSTFSTGTLTPGQAIRRLLDDRANHNTGYAIQEALFSDGPALEDVDFIVVDVETTGIGASARLTEIAAARARGGRVVDVFSSLVNPHQIIPPKITAMTGITNSMVIGAPDLDQVFPKFLQFADFHHGSVFVAHNAPFDHGFIRRAAQSLNIVLPQMTIIDTLVLSRLILPRPLVARHNLATMATYFATSVRPSHRAGDDVAATVEVLYGLIDLVRPLGVTHLGDLALVSRPVFARRASKKPAITANVRPVPGVYHFLSTHGDVLYVGSATNLHSRISSYFSASEHRKKIRAMLDVVHSVTTFACPDVFTARIRELHDIKRLTPAYNVRIPGRGRTWLLKPGRNDSSRLQAGTLIDHDMATMVGPFRSKRQAMAAADLINGSRLKPRPAADIAALCDGDCRAIVDSAYHAMVDVAKRERYEEAADHRRRLKSLLYGLRRGEMLRPILFASRLIIAYPLGDGQWRYVGVAYGRVVLRAISRSFDDIEAVLSLIDTTWPDIPPQSTRQIDDGLLIEETVLIYRLMVRHGSRLVAVDSPYPIAFSTTGAHRYDELWAQLQTT